MKPKFFVGQKVRCRTATGQLVVGHIYTVLLVEMEFIAVEEINNGNNSYYKSRFIPFTPNLDDCVELSNYLLTI